MADAPIIGRAFRKCGNCNTTELVPKDVTKRICKGGPPCCVPLPTPAGILVQSFWPIVDVNDSACARWEMKPLADQAPAGKS